MWHDKIAFELYLQPRIMLFRHSIKIHCNVSNTLYCTLIVYSIHYLYHWYLLIRESLQEILMETFVCSSKKIPVCIPRNCPKKSWKYTHNTTNTVQCCYTCKQFKTLIKYLNLMYFVYLNSTLSGYVRIQYRFFLWGLVFGVYPITSIHNQDYSITSAFRIWIIVLLVQSVWIWLL